MGSFLGDELISRILQWALRKASFIYDINLSQNEELFNRDALSSKAVVWGILKEESFAILYVLSLKGSPKILVALLRKGELTYSELSRVVGGPATTSRAIKALSEMGMINRKVLDERYRPVVYSLTEKGRVLAELVIRILELHRKLD